MVYESPKIKEKIDNYVGDPRIKEILKRAYEQEKSEIILSQSESTSLNGYTRLIAKYIDDDDLIDKCEK